MAYATYAELVTMWGEIEVVRSSDRDGDGVADVGVVDRALDDASAEIDSYIGQTYKLPINPVPPVLATHCGRIALYQMSLDSGTYTKEKRQRYEDSLKWLRDVAAGKASLDGVGQPASKAGPVLVFTEPREYSRTKLWGIL